jgi:hypothetical protein
MALPPSGDKQALVSAIEQRILTGPGMAPPDLRAKGFEGSDLPEPLAHCWMKSPSARFR